jgi:hypothetical protein
MNSDLNDYKVMFYYSVLTFISMSFKTGLSNEFCDILQLSEHYFGSANKTMGGQNLN